MNPIETEAELEAIRRSLQRGRPLARRSLALAMAMLVAFAARSPAVIAETARPNVVFILVDDLGWTDLGCFGSDLYQTPHIDQLARDGMKFTQAYSACTVCSPTRAALLTGKYPAR